MFVKDIYSEFKAQTGGACDATAVLNRITDAQRLVIDRFPDARLNLQTMDICLCGGVMTLPEFVEAPIAVNANGIPQIMRDVWYQHHLNGVGSRDATTFGYADDLGYACTFREIATPSYIVASIDSQADNNKGFRVYGDDINDRPIRTKDSTGVERDGFLVPLVYGSKAANSAVPPVKRITRISADPREGRLTLYAVDPATSIATTIGIYEPYETEPRYSRYRVSTQASWVRMSYRRKTMQLRSVYDWIPIDNRMVMLLAGKAIKEYLDGNMEAANAFKLEAFTQFENSELARLAPSLSLPQVKNYETVGGADNLLYNDLGYRTGAFL